MVLPQDSALEKKLDFPGNDGEKTAVSVKTKIEELIPDDGTESLRFDVLLFI